MTQLEKLVNYVAQLPEGDELTAFVYKLAADSAMLKSYKSKRTPQPKRQEKQVFKFTKKEIYEMPEPIRILLMYGEYEVPYSVYRNSYRARLRKDGYCIEVYDKNLDNLRKKFLKAAMNYKPKEVQKEDTSTPFMKDFASLWLQTREINIKETTLKGYQVILNSQVIPVFGEKRLKEITRADIQEHLTNLVKQEKFRTAQKLKIVLSSIFELAAEDFGIKSPMKKIILPHYEAKKGSSLSKEEEKKTVDYCITHIDNPVYSAILILLYTGMRVGELQSAELHEKYIECETEKIRKGYSIERRKIPLSPMYRKVMRYIDFERAKMVKGDYINRSFQKIMPKRHTHELRYTFITRAKECGCNLELVMLWDGHKFDEHVKSSAVDRGYTTYSDETYFGEIEKINYDL